LQISAKRAKQGNPPHLANAADFMKSKHEIEHDFQGDPKRRFIGGIFPTKSKNEHVFRVSLNGPENTADFRQSAAFSKKRTAPNSAIVLFNRRFRRK